MHTKNSVSTHTLKPMNRETATLLATRLLGSYPSLNLHDPETFMTELVVAFLKYPQWVGEQAVVDAKRASPIYVPSVPLVEKSCEDAIVQTREAFTYAQQWEQQSRLQLQERHEIDQAATEESAEHRAAVVARIRRDMATAGMPFEADRKRHHGETEDTVKTKLGLNDEKWAAIPNAPTNWKQVGKVSE